MKKEHSHPIISQEAMESYSFFSNFATKQDIFLLKQDLKDVKDDLKDAKNDLKEDIRGIKHLIWIGFITIGGTVIAELTVSLLKGH